MHLVKGIVLVYLYFAKAPEALQYRSNVGTSRASLQMPRGRYKLAIGSEQSAVDPESSEGGKKNVDKFQGKYAPWIGTSILNRSVKKKTRTEQE